MVAGLGVGGEVRRSVRPEGHRVRIDVEIIDASTPHRFGVLGDPRLQRQSS
jgi:hypothetical protein